LRCQHQPSQRVCATINCFKLTKSEKKKKAKTKEKEKEKGMIIVGKPKERGSMFTANVQGCDLGRWQRDNQLIHHTGSHLILWS
jgi:hypothetical protein